VLLERGCALQEKHSRAERSLECFCTCACLCLGGGGTGMEVATLQRPALRCDSVERGATVALAVPVVGRQLLPKEQCYMGAAG
jgi:hypothetical protein